MPDRKESGIIKVNLGCGKNWLHDWINIDNNWNARIRKHPLLHFLVPSLKKLNLINTSIRWPQNLMLHDIRKRLPFEDNYADFIYMSAVIEHLKKYEAINCLRECYRILKIGGTIRILTPDLDYFASRYMFRDVEFYYKKFAFKLSNNDTFADRFLSLIYDEANKEPKSLRYKIKSRFIPFHKWLYDFESISVILSRMGFKDVKRCIPRQGSVPDLDKLEEDAPENLCIEARKL